jgi:hypothetical protein
MADSRKALEIIRDEFHTASRQGPKLFHAMYRFRGGKLTGLGSDTASPQNP